MRSAGLELFDHAHICTANKCYCCTIIVLFYQSSSVRSSNPASAKARFRHISQVNWRDCQRKQRGEFSSIFCLTWQFIQRQDKFEQVRYKKIVGCLSTVTHKECSHKTSCESIKIKVFIYPGIVVRTALNRLGHQNQVKSCFVPLESQFNCTLWRKYADTVHHLYWVQAHFLWNRVRLKQKKRIDREQMFKKGKIVKLPVISRQNDKPCLM